MIKSIRIHVLFLIVFFSCFVHVSNTSCQQSGAWSSNVLATAINTSENFLANGYQTEMGAMDYSLPILEKLEIRTETDRMTLGRQEFMIRSSFNTFKLKNAITDERKAFVNWKNTEYQSNTRDKLYDTYQQILQLVKVKNKQNLHKASSQYLSNQIQLYEKMLAAGEPVDLVDYLELKNNLLLANVEDEEYEVEMRMLYGNLGFSGIEPDTLSLLRVDDAVTVVNFLDLNNDLHPKNLENTAKLNFLEATYEKEKAKTSKLLDFVQTKYTVREDLLLENRFSIGLGLLIPWKGSSKIELNDIASKKKETEYENTLFFQDNNQKITQLRSMFENKVSLYRKLNTIQSEGKSSLLKKTITESNNVSPLKLAKIKGEELKLSEKINEVEADILAIYIQMLHASGILYHSPYRNYLLTTTPIISNK